MTVCNVRARTGIDRLLCISLRFCARCSECGLCLSRLSSILAACSSSFCATSIQHLCILFTAHIRIYSLACLLQQVACTIGRYSFFPYLEFSLAPFLFMHSCSISQFQYKSDIGRRTFFHNGSRVLCIIIMHY